MRAFLVLVVVLWMSAISSSARAVFISDVLTRGPVADEKPSVTRYWQGIDALAQGDIRSAETAFHDSVRMDPTWYGPLLGLADAAVKDGRPRDADSWLERATEMAPRSAEVAIARGRFYFMQGQPLRAEAAYKMAISLDEKAFLPHLDLADLYLQNLWKPREAVTAYQTVLRMSPDHAGAHYGLGVALVATGEPDEAITELNTSIALEPENPLPHVALGKLYQSLGEYQKAVAAFSRALKVKPDLAIVHVYRGDALAATGDVNAAIVAYQAAIEAAPKLSVAYFKLGSIYQFLQRWDEAENAFLKATETDPRNARAYNNLAWIAAERNERLDDALAWATRAVEISPDVVTYQDTLGWVLRARGEPEKAVEVLERASAADPKLAEIPYHIGIIYSEQGKKREAIAAFKKALEVDRDFSSAVDAEKRIEALSTN